MEYLGLIFLFSGILLCGLITMGMAAKGLFKGKVYHTAGCPPIVFREQRIKFVLLVLCLIGISAGFFKAVVVLARKLM